MKLTFLSILQFPTQFRIDQPRRSSPTAAKVPSEQSPNCIPQDPRSQSHSHSSFARACVRDGHEIAAHGLRWLDIGEYTVEQEWEYITENALSLERTTGVFPKGYFYGRASPNIRGMYPEVMKEMGRKLLYSSESCFNDDVPYWVDLPWEKKLKEEREGLLVIPYNYDCNGECFMNVTLA